MIPIKSGRKSIKATNLEEQLVYDLWTIKTKSDWVYYLPEKWLEFRYSGSFSLLQNLKLSTSNDNKWSQ